MDSEQLKECEDSVEVQKHREFRKAAIVVGSGFVFMFVLCLISPYFQPEADPLGFIAKMIWSSGLATLAVVTIISLVCAFNWVTKHDWWEELKQGNLAVAYVIAGACVSIGLALSGIL
ncbi:MAG: DUF350 domain-containing protein [Actinomycetota bacterium]